MLKTVGTICIIIAIFVVIMAIAFYLHDKLDKQIEEEVKQKHDLINKAFKHNYDIQKVSDVIDESWYKLDEYKEFLDLIKEPYQFVKYYKGYDYFEYYENDWTKAITVNLGRGEIVEEAYKRWVEKKIVEEALKKEEAVKNLLDKAYDTPENHEVIVDEEVRQKLPVKLYKDGSGNYYSVVETDAIPSDWIFVRRFADKIDAAAYAKRQPDFRYKPYLEFVEELKNNPSDDLEERINKRGY